MCDSSTVIDSSGLGLGFLKMTIFHSYSIWLETKVNTAEDGV
jgi:hypothetical protein